MSYFEKDVDVRHYLCGCEFKAAAIRDWARCGWHGMYCKYAHYTLNVVEYNLNTLNTSS